MANTALEVWRANRSLYGADKLATAMRKAGHDVGRDQVARLMGIVGIEGVRRGKHQAVTTIRDPKATRHPDLIRRAWKTPTRPDQWWVADFTYVWTLEGFVYTSFVTDVCSRRILGWRVTASKTTPLVMSVLEQALFTRAVQEGVVDQADNRLVGIEASDDEGDHGHPEAIDAPRPGAHQAVIGVMGPAPGGVHHRHHPADRAPARGAHPGADQLDEQGERGGSEGASGAAQQRLPARP
jgi:hypothetical protein